MIDVEDWPDPDEELNGDTDDHIRCKRCGADNLYWAKLPRGWTLHEYYGDKIHVCRIGPNRKTTAVEDFK